LSFTCEGNIKGVNTLKQWGWRRDVAVRMTDSMWGSDVKKGCSFYRG